MPIEFMIKGICRIRGALLHFLIDSMKRASIFRSLVLVLVIATGLPAVLWGTYAALGGTVSLAGLGFVWLAGFLASLGLGWFLYARQIQGPINALLQAADAATRGDLQTHVTLPESSELGQLAAHFNTMIEVRDVHDKAQSQAKEKYRMLVEQLPVVIYRSSADRLKSALYVNAAMGELLGYTPQEWLANGSLWYECVHPQDRDRVMDALKNLRASDGALQLEYRMYARDGRLVWVRDDVCALSRGSGKPPFLQGALFDLTAHKLADEKLAYHAKLLEQLRDAVIATDVYQKITVWNRAAVEIYGWTAQEASGEYLDAMVRVESPPVLQDAADGLQRALATHSRKNGETFPVETSVLPLRGADGQVNGYLHVFRDLTRRRTAEPPGQSANEEARQSADESQGSVVEMMPRAAAAHPT